MKLSKLFSVYTLLGLVMLAFSISMIFSFDNLRKYEKLAQAEITDATWVIYQAEIELTRFLYSLDIYMYGDEDLISRGDVIERMEIFWSRLPLFLEGREGRRLSKIGDTQEAARAAIDVLERMEPEVQALERGDRERYLKIRKDLHGLLAPLHRNLMDARQWQQGAAAIRSERLDRGYVELLLASLGILISGGCLMLLLLHEIREARRAQAAEESALSRLSEAVDSFADGFSLFDSKDRLVQCNQQFRDMHAPIADMLVPGVSFESFVRAHVSSGFVVDAIGNEEEWIRRRMRVHRHPMDDLEVKHTDGRWLRVSERRTGDGGCVSIRTDITALKERQEDLASQQQRADSANRAKTDFLLTMSHELRTPLNAIIGFSEVMKQQLRGPLGDERYVDYASDIYESARHLLAVINNILDISRIEAGRLELDEQAVVIGDEIEKALRFVEDEAKAANIVLVRDIDDDLPLLLGDPHKIQQIVVNLAGNSVRYMQNTGQVTVSARRDADGGIVLAVADDGQGMPPEDVQRVISPFVRLSNPMVRQHDGTGLGLPLVKALVELHGGRFSLNSDIGKGTEGIAVFPKTRVIQPESTTA
ncbi:MAG: PAS domain-containing sensor histidine kinase [Alphaproteobacteria bacterium]|nr:PAS domain-containing sensor histidine kinase [Alphaproteobacteria bacterium]